MRLLGCWQVWQVWSVGEASGNRLSGISSVYPLGLPGWARCHEVLYQGILW